MSGIIKITAVLYVCFLTACNKVVLVEAESFTEKGGWVIDQQFMDRMGSPFLMAHGMGIPVEDASTMIEFPVKGRYRVYVRTRNWVADCPGENAPGRFRLIIDGNEVNADFGNQSAEWGWQDGGVVEITKKNVTVSLKDLTGFNGRCDALLFAADPAFIPPEGADGIADLRKKLNPAGRSVKEAGQYDFVVIGGGMAGTCASIAAARSGLKVALVQDRPLLGGNNSSEVRVHLGGRINLEPYPQLGNLVNEIGPSKGGNARPAENNEDSKKLDAVRREPNISLFLNFRADKVSMKDGRIVSIVAVSTETGERLSFTAPLFADCTGDASIGVLAGAKYMSGRESSSEFGESTAPDISDKMTMGSSVQWYAEENTEGSSFPDLLWGIPWDENKAEHMTRGDWNWETGMNNNQITEFEQIRDYGLLVVYSNWSYLKNHSVRKDEYAKQQLKWVAFIAGKRESRRLTGDYVLSESDLVDHKLYADGTASTSWSIDLHYPDPDNSEHFPGKEFKSIAEHKVIYPYPVPFRCLYSINVPNLMMAGRNISVTHVALGTVRVMRTTGMMGEVIGMAASVCRKFKTDPRGVYENHFDDLKALMLKGAGDNTLSKIQDYNLGGSMMEFKEVSNDEMIK